MQKEHEDEDDENECPLKNWHTLHPKQKKPLYERVEF